MLASVYRRLELERLRSIVDSSTDLIFVKNWEFRLILVSKSLANAMSMAPSDMENHYDYEFWPKELCEGSPENGIRGYHDEDLKTLNGQESTVIEKVVLADKTEHMFETRRIPLQDLNGNIYAVLGTARDISNDILVIERTKQLDASNKELQAFSYSVSHDLRNPLHAVNGWSNLLLDCYRDKLDEDGQNYIDNILHETQKMTQIITGLLELSEITQKDLNIQSCPISELVKIGAGRIEVEHANRTFKFSIESDLTVNADKNMLSILLNNLLNNAAKYTSKELKPCIEFGQKIIEGREYFFIKDNGVGFDMKTSEDPFKAFQRLHSSSDFPGTGIGLDTVKRIVQKHDGKIWIEAELEQGATVYFALNNGDNTH